MNYFYAWLVYKVFVRESLEPDVHITSATETASLNKLRKTCEWPNKYVDHKSRVFVVSAVCFAWRRFTAQT